MTAALSSVQQKLLPDLCPSVTSSVLFCSSSTGSVTLEINASHQLPLATVCAGKSSLTSLFLFPGGEPAQRTLRDGTLSVCVNRRDSPTNTGAETGFVTPFRLIAELLNTSSLAQLPNLNQITVIPNTAELNLNLKCPNSDRFFPLCVSKQPKRNVYCWLKKILLTLIAETLSFSWF